MLKNSEISINYEELIKNAAKLIYNIDDNLAIISIAKHLSGIQQDWVKIDRSHAEIVEFTTILGRIKNSIEAADYVLLNDLLCGDYKKIILR